jgi:hypothetical protein
MKHEGRIIPKEEVLANRSNAYEFIDFDNCKDCNKSLEDCTCINNTLDMKQETLEEASERIYQDEEIVNDYDISGYLQSAFLTGVKWQQEQYTIEEQHVGHTIDELDKEYIKGFNEGSAWQEEKSYTEEEVNSIFYAICKHSFFEDNVETVYLQNVKDEFEQFKKK